MASTLDLTTGIVYLKTGASINTSGNITGGDFTANGANGFIVNNAGFFYWITRAALASPADAQVRVTNNALTTGAILDVSTDNTLYVKNRTGAAGGTLRAAALLLDSGINSYNNIATVGFGVPAIVGLGRFTAQVAAKASVAAYTVGAADGTFEVSANILITTATTHSFTATVAYTDEGNTARTTTLNFATVAGVISNAAITNAGGAVPYEGVPYHIRCKAATAITIATTGTFTSVAYNVEGVIKQTA